MSRPMREHNVMYCCRVELCENSDKGHQLQIYAIWPRSVPLRLPFRQAKVKLLLSLLVLVLVPRFTSEIPIRNQATDVGSEARRRRECRR